MTAIYLRHPRHGVKVATMEMEAQHDETNGWVRFELEDLLTDKADDGFETARSADPDNLPEPTVEANVMSEAPRRRGRPRASKDE